MSVEEEVVRLTAFIREKGGGDAFLLSAELGVTGEWVRMKCLFGCNGFRWRFSSPPYTPTPSEMRAGAQRIYAYVAGAVFWGCRRNDVGAVGLPRDDAVCADGDVCGGEYDVSRWVLPSIQLHRSSVRLVREVLCKGEGDSDYDKNRRRRRPSMEAAGIDVYAICANAGWDLGVLGCTQVPGGSVLDAPMTTIILLLLE